ncbi:hypothetical protein BDR07DRAFT_541679 [Suillus spraguei]|nr:hypothetical protein BDR07DRAFT_541679 [Suillus spraguei]
MQTTDSKVNSPPASATTGAVVVQSNTLRPVCSSAICRLPTEILSEIFVHCLPQDDDFSPRTRLAPLLFTMICRRWRQVAIGFPRLWCRLRLEVWDTDWQKLAVCCDSWLQRTRGCPLSLRLDCHNDWDKIQSILQPYARQISSLELHFRTKGLFMVEDFHALEELKITLSVPHYYPSLSMNRSLKIAGQFAQA